MGEHIPRTAAEDLHDTLAALADARTALKNVQSQLDSIIATPDEPAGRAHEARRNTRIAVASLDAAESRARAAGRSQLTSVS
jgi:hypothetical protein